MLIFKIMLKIHCFISYWWSITWEFKEILNTFVKAKSESELNSQEKIHNKNLSFYESQAGTSFDQRTIFKLEADSIKVAEQMLVQQAQERQTREKRQQGEPLSS